MVIPSYKFTGTIVGRTGLMAEPFQRRTMTSMPKFVLLTVLTLPVKHTTRIAAKAVVLLKEIVNWSKLHY